MSTAVARRPKLQGDAPLTAWELEKVRCDADVAHKLYVDRRRAASTQRMAPQLQIDMWGRVYWREDNALHSDC